MELKATQVLQVLRNKGATALFHANTVRTSCTFLREGHLLARGVVEERCLPQTAQQSDAIDMKYGVWFDLFLDCVNIHQRIHKRNNYGPILFEFDLEVLNEDWLPTLWVTKKNPQDWTDEDSPSNQYFTSVEDFASRYRLGDFASMLVLRHCGGMLRLKTHLRQLFVDNPNQRRSGVDLFSQAVGALRASRRTAGLSSLKIRKHACQLNCTCTEQYAAMEQETMNKFFVP